MPSGGLTILQKRFSDKFPLIKNHSGKVIAENQSGSE